MSLPRAAIVALVLLVTALAPPALGRDKPGKDDDAPRPTEDELKEIRQLMRRVVRGPHPSLRSEAATALGNYGRKAEVAIPALVTALKDRDVSVSSTAAVALGKVGGESRDAVRALVEALERDPSLAMSAAEALGRIGVKAAPALPALLKALGHEEADLRREAALALGHLGPEAEKQAPTPLRARLDDAEPRVRLAAALSLTRLNVGADDRVLTVLTQAVPKGGRMVIELRQAACEALTVHGPRATGAVSALLECLRERPDVNPAIPYADQRLEQHNALRRAAATALGAIGDAQALPGLRDAASNPALQEAAEAAIARLEGN
jgi:HEAT repeat protein